MPRSGAEARDRLQRAALKLYGERGYDRTTTAEIAAEAGVTERTFFRHFADKREVFFGAEADTLQWLATALADVPDSVSPLAAVLQAVRSRVPVYESKRPLFEARRRVITATPALRERELTKEAAMSSVVAGALLDRGLSEWRATLLAEIAMAAQGHAIRTWSANPSADIDAVIVASFAELREAPEARPSVNQRG
jgi:AcrR family transcriptional regulator